VTWVANALILWGMYLVGRKRKACFLFSATGELIWTVCACRSGQYDLAFICGVFVVVALLNYRKWRRDDLINTEKETT
jgi:hypothetical protein